ncbi:MAG: hypothetical protein RLZZ427_1278 [Pseudomonadota bacterium]|jgi:hypothetical protein
MSAWIRQSQVGRSLLMLAVLLAVLLALATRVLVPTGFMPTAASAGLTVTLCAETGGKSVTIDLGKPAPAGKPHAAEALCGFAAGLGQGLLGSAAVPVLSAPFSPVPMLLGVTLARFTVHRLAAPPPPAQAPPALR